MRFTSILLLCISTCLNTSLFALTVESSTCSDAFTKSVDSLCNRTTHQVGLTQNQYWMQFTATSTNIQLNTIINETAPAISAVQLISGTCSNFQIIETDSSFAIGDIIAFTSNLVIGQTYYICFQITSNGEIPRTACDLTIPALITIPDVVVERFKNYGRFIDGSIPNSLPNLNQLRFAKEHTYRKMSFDPNYIALGAPDDSLYSNFIADYQNSETKRVIDVQQNILNENYSTAILQNSTIGSSCFHSENNKLIQSIYLNSLDSGLVIISATDSTILEDMACQDPLEFGNAVYQARAMIGWLHPCDFGGGGAKSLILNDNSDEVLLNIQRGTIKLFPNPSKGDFTINSSEFEIMEVIIRDLSGKIIYHHADLTTTEIQLHLEKNPKGLYLLEIKLSNNVSHHDKIIIE
jgi:hypothetical protein